MKNYKDKNKEICNKKRKKTVPFHPFWIFYLFLGVRDFHSGDSEPAPMRLFRLIRLFSLFIPFSADTYSDCLRKEEKKKLYIV